ncbi:MAG: tetratricopeptide repeat protein [Silicimonas sp.]|nr:tetratricopeptide repeat protein [Silicimonas sp.]
MSLSLRSALLISALALAACDSAEERAEKHFQKGMELLESGDRKRALVEFRNVFALDKTNKKTRLAYARTARELGNIPESYSNFLRVAELEPQNMEARLALTEMAIVAQNWDEAERHGEVLLAAETPVAGSEIPALALAFREAVQAGDATRVREITRDAEALAEATPDNEILHRILIEGYMSEGEIDKAIAITDRALEKSPDRELFYRVKGMLLSQKQDPELLEAHLRATIAKFPKDEETKALLVRLLAQQGDLKGAQDFLRSEIDAAEDKLAAHVTLIAFIQQSEGAEAARAELETALPLYENANVLLALKAGLLFDAGERNEAIAILEGVVGGAEPGAETDRYKVTLARMLVSTGNEVGARKLVGEVLEADAGQVEALKMRAAWQIEADEADEAISTLRRALDQAPEDAQAMTLMARAHERNGNSQLAQDLLALAVDASGNAAPESLRFATLLVEQERFTNAEEVLIKALRNSPGNFDLLNLLGNVYLNTEDWPRAEQVVASLKRLPGERAQTTADQLRLQITSRVKGLDEGIALLEEMAGADGSGGGQAKVALIRARLAQNQPEEALALARELVEEFPDSAEARQVLGNTQFATGDFAAAEETLAAVAEETGVGADILQLARVLGAQGKGAEAQAAIDKGLAEAPDNADLLWAKASYLEGANDIDGAIEIYAALYERNSGSPVVANNLASLLATYRDDEESLERAYTVARRLRGTEVPPFQDTIGWILFRRGEAEEAVSYLEPAAAALGGDPVVQYHLGRAYEAVGRKADAIAQFEKAVTIAGADDLRPQITDAAARRDALAAALEAEGADQ